MTWIIVLAYIVVGILVSRFAFRIEYKHSPHETWEAYWGRESNGTILFFYLCALVVWPFVLIGCGYGALKRAHKKRCGSVGFIKSFIEGPKGEKR